MSDAGTPTVPQASPGRDYLGLREPIDEAIRRVLESGWYILGPEVEAFEAEFSAYLGVRHGIGVANGTDALELALRGLGIGEGDAVFSVSHTAVATIAAIERTGATPVLLDVDDQSFNLDPSRLEAALARPRNLGGARPRAVVAVHLYGQPADMPRLLEVSRRAGLVVVEDCAQAHGARLEGRLAGTFGDAACFSFYPTKNLGALGDGGFVAVDDPIVAQRVRQLRQYGWRERYVSATVGVNSRLDELQAAVLRVKLPHLDAANARRREIAAQYDSQLVSTRVRTPAVVPGVEHVYHQYVIRVASDERDLLMAHLRSRGVGVAIHYPMAVHRQAAYAGRLPVPHALTTTDRLVTEIVSLPMFPSLDDRDVAWVASALAAFDARPGRSAEVDIRRATPHRPA